MSSLLFIAEMVEKYWKNLCACVKRLFWFEANLYSVNTGKLQKYTEQMDGKLINTNSSVNLIGFLQFLYTFTLKKKMFNLEIFGAGKK